MELDRGKLGLAEQVNQLEAALDAGWHVPGTRRVLVDLAMMLELIDQIRISIPEQVLAAQQVLEHGEQVLAATRAEADAVLVEARREAQRRLADKVLNQAAAARAAQIEQQAWRAAEVIDCQADQDAAECLRSLRAWLGEVDRVLAQPLPPPARVDGSHERVETDAPIGRSASGTRRSWAA